MGVIEKLKSRIEKKKAEKDDKKRVKASADFGHDKKIKERLNTELGYGVDGHRPEAVRVGTLLEELGKVQERITKYKKGVQEIHDDDLFVEGLIENENAAISAKRTYNSYQSINRTLVDRVKIESVEPSQTMLGKFVSRMLVSDKEFRHMYERPLGVLIYNQPQESVPKDAGHKLMFESRPIFKQTFIDSITRNPKHLKACSVFDLKCLMSYADGDVLAKISGGIRESLEDKYELIKEDSTESQKAEINTLLGYVDVIEHGANEYVNESVK